MPELTDAEMDQLVEVIDSIDPPKRRRKLSTRVALTLMLYMLRSNVSWKDLQLQMTGITYWAVYKRFRHWVQAGVFDNSRVQLTKVYVVGQLLHDPRAFSALLIDTTLSKNVAGRDCAGRNGSDRGRQATKLSGICDRNMVLLSRQFYPGNRNDVTTLVPAVEGIVCNIRRDARYKCTLVADKGYISAAHARTLAERHDITMLVPPRKNMARRQWTPKEVALMKMRHLIENVWCHHDKSKRLMVRMDVTIASYAAFHDLAIIKTLLQKTQHVFI